MMDGQDLIVTLSSIVRGTHHCIGTEWCNCNMIHLSQRMRGPDATPHLCITSIRRMLNGGKRGEPLGWGF